VARQGACRLPSSWRHAAIRRGAGFVGRPRGPFRQLFCGLEVRSVFSCGADGAAARRGMASLRPSTPGGSGRSARGVGARFTRISAGLSNGRHGSIGLSRGARTVVFAGSASPSGDCRQRDQAPGRQWVVAPAPLRPTHQPPLRWLQDEPWWPSGARRGAGRAPTGPGVVATAGARAGETGAHGNVPRMQGCRTGKRRGCQSSVDAPGDGA
jgi:hypothetical protein